MSGFEDLDFSPPDFPETVRLFPLPNLVLFPHVVQPLHIFEPRYREMLMESLQADRLIAMATLAPGWEEAYEENPPISPHGCLGRIMLHEELTDGRHNILLAGLSRIEVLREMPSAKPFRVAVAALREDRSVQDGNLRSSKLYQQLQEALVKLLPFVPDAREQLGQLLEREIPLGTLTDLVAYLLDLELSEKLVLLGETRVTYRAEMLANRLATLRGDCRPNSRSTTPFPPPFSAN